MHAFDPHQRSRRPDQAATETESEQAEHAADEVAEQITRGGLFSVPYDFSDVRIHHDEAAVRSIGAVAYTLGKDIVLGDRSGAALAHELGHVVADAHRTAPPVVRKLVRPEDVSSEMVGTSMVTVAAVTTPGGTVGAGATVTVLDWVNDSSTARVRFPVGPGGPAVEADVSKALLRPVRRVAPGVAPLSAGVAKQAATVQRGAAAIAAEAARPGGPRPGEIPRLEALQKTREAVLNRRLIQETMFNRFDPLIKYWTDHYNAQFGYRPSAGLDPNLVKSMLFQESQMGTAGEHLMPVPATPISRKTRFNLGQVIDTSGPALLIMISEASPALMVKHQLTDLRRDLIKAQTRHDDLKKMASRTAADDAELAGLDALSATGGSWESFFWAYRATGSATGFTDAVLEFFTPAAGGVSRRMDYEFWIRAAIRWLFEKRKNVSSWPEAIRAYNGSGADAAAYRDEVVGRAKAAVQAEKAGKNFTPTGV